MKVVDTDQANAQPRVNAEEVGLCRIVLKVEDGSYGHPVEHHRGKVEEGVNEFQDPMIKTPIDSSSDDAIHNTDESLAQVQRSHRQESQGLVWRNTTVRPFHKFLPTNILLEMESLVSKKKHD
ncbi:unnamed protein product [Protopolystoma xenopodis]|uniref:Uncharacterized protein n=1 Tax=Protopolystoma xenopodis TaxID=117903 RepID=A0A448WY81_9PLAT|nr:unnamed protein product [Protopolystoma xenopodis]